MLDVLKTLAQSKIQRKQNFISIVELLDFIQLTNLTANFAEIVDFLFLKLKENNPRTTSIDINSAKFIDYEIKVYKLPLMSYEDPMEVNIDFFEAIMGVKNSFLEMEAFPPLEGSTINLKRAVNFIHPNHKDAFISRQQIGNLLDVTIPLDEKELKDYKQTREFYLVGELTKLNEGCANSAIDFIDDKKKELNQTENTNITTQITELQNCIAELEKRNAELEKENQNLKKPELENNAVNCNNHSIYGHTSENLEFLFKFAKQISEKCDPVDLHSYPEKEHYQEYFEKYLTKNNSLAEAFYKILTPENVKNKGRKPEGVDTFQGFI